MAWRGGWSTVAGALASPRLTDAADPACRGGATGYVLGRFVPDRYAARAILDHVVRHAASEEGRVPVHEWLRGVKNHFIVRVPPPGLVAE